MATAPADLDQTTKPTATPLKPELLAPAGDRTCAVAAVENGADAIYFGIQGHNARARAANFTVEELPDLIGLLHRRGVKGYATLNTLAFSNELDDLERYVRRIAEAGVDAVIVQDIGLARLIRAITPDLEIHGSTQMSITSTEGVRLAKELGCSRVILARELSLAEIESIRAEVDLPVEVFVHGALCVAYSGQCLTSEALGGRSANRGECAQACRLPYEIICDGEPVDMGKVQYLLSPQDLAAFDLVPRLIELGVSSLKIEGRLKSPEYVANITSHYRKAIDEALSGKPAAFSPDEVRDMELSFSRGFSHGFLDGNNHKVLVRGDYCKKRGVFVGTVTKVVGQKVYLNLAAPVKPGDGLVFDGDDDIPEQGGRLYEVRRTGGPRRNESGPISAGPVALGFGRNDLDARKLVVGQRAWKTDDPELTKRLKKSFEGGPKRKVALSVHLTAASGRVMEIEGRVGDLRVAVQSPEPLAVAQSRLATTETLREQFDRLGGTVYELSDFDATIEGGPMVPSSVLNQLRRDLVERLDAETVRPPLRAIASEPVLPRFRESFEAIRAATPKAEPELIVLCRTTEQIRAAAGAGIRTIYADYQDIKEYKHAVAAAREAGVRLYLATPRIEKPGEGPIFKYLAKQEADGILVRNAGGLAFCLAQNIPFVADFSLNASNELTVEFFKARGAERVTASYDLNVDQLDDLLRAAPASWLEVVIHQQIPMFHMEHCVFCAFLSPGTDKSNCGRPCDSHQVLLRDRVGAEHPLKADVGCRNTLYNAVPQTAAEYLPRLLEHGVAALRIEFLDDTPANVQRTLTLYRDALANRRDARTLWKDLKASGKYGVTRGPLAIL